MAKIVVTIEWAENYGASSLAVPGCVATGSTLNEVKENFESAVAFHKEGLQTHQMEIPSEIVGEYEFVYELTVQAILKHLDGILTRAALARATGIAEAQLYHYISGMKKPREGQRLKIINGIRAIGSDILAVV